MNIKLGSIVNCGKLGPERPSYFIVVQNELADWCLSSKDRTMCINFSTMGMVVGYMEIPFSGEQERVVVLLENNVFVAIPPDLLCLVSQ